MESDLSFLAAKKLKRQHDVSGEDIANFLGWSKSKVFGRFRIDIESKKGVLLDEMFPSNMGKQIIESHNVTLKDEGITKRESKR